MVEAPTRQDIPGLDQSELTANSGEDGADSFAYDPYEEVALKRSDRLSEGWSWFNRSSIKVATIIPVVLALAVIWAKFSRTWPHLGPSVSDGMDEGSSVTRALLGLTWVDDKIDRVQSMLNGFSAGSVAAFLWLINSRFGQKINTRFDNRRNSNQRNGLQ